MFGCNTVGKVSAFHKKRFWYLRDESNGANYGYRGSRALYAPIIDD